MCVCSIFNYPSTLMQSEESCHRYVCVCVCAMMAIWQRGAASAREEMRSDHKKHFALALSLFNLLACFSLRLSIVAPRKTGERVEEATNHKTIFFLLSFDVLFSSFSLALASCYRGISFNQLHPMYATTI